LEKEWQSMSATVLQDPGLYAMLIAIDEELTATKRARGCPHCGAKLHDGGFPRKPRGCPARYRAAFSRRTSLDCSRCRQRTMPASVRFLSRRVYLAAVFVLVSPRGTTTASWLTKHLGIPVRTVDRWRAWWRHDFRSTPFWQLERAHFVEICEQYLPGSILERFQADSPLQRLLLFLRFLLPLSTRVLHP
jgi:hypothetical protein